MIASGVRSIPRASSQRRFTLVLILFTSSILALGLAAFVSGLSPALALLAAGLGTFAGWLLAALPIRGWLAVGSAAVLGGLLTLTAVGGLDTGLIDLGEEVARIYASFLPAVLSKAPVDYQPLLRSVEQLTSAIGVLLTRWFHWSVAWLGGNSPIDPVAALLTWTLAIWAATAWAGWTMRRSSFTWKAFLPAGILLSTTLAFSGGAPTTLYWFLLALIPLAAMATQDIRQLRWRKSGVQYRSSVRKGVGLGSLAISVALVIGALVTQPISPQRLIRFAQDFTDSLTDRRVQVAEVLGVEQIPRQAVLDAANLERQRNPGLPRQHLIGSGPELSGQIVMIVQTSDRSLERPLLDPAETAQRYYWRSNTYDVYTGRGWRTGATELRDYVPGELLIEDERPGHRLLTQEIVAVEPLSGRIFSAGDVVTIDEPFSVEWRSSEDPFGARFETQTDRFRVASQVPQPIEDQLRSAEANYPGWILSRYLAIPDTMSDRVLDLALELTATAPTPYDRALLIEAYLRQIPYSLDVPTPPSDREITDYFLFELQQGYCDYYATSMVMLARASGLPARLAVGYLSGNFEPTQGAYIVTEADAHSWVEIYFPVYGWIDFEPTGGRPPIARAGDAEPAVSTDIDAFLDTIEFSPNELASQPPDQGRDVLSLLLLALAAAGALLGLLVLMLRWRVRRLPLHAVSVEIHRGLRDQAVGLGVTMEPGTTASELSTALSERLSRPSPWPQRLQGLLPSVTEIQFLLRTYTDLTYRRPGPPIRLKKADLLRIWRTLRWQLRLQRIRDRVSNNLS